jgi:DNA-directed RNA polymerase subunit RPC12/RpoP
MTTAPNASKALPQARTPDKFTLEKTTFGGITFLTLNGTLDQAFEGRKTADAIHTKKVVVNLRNVRRFASWGMSEWMDFLRINAARELYLVECSTYAMSQINLVTGLLGHAKLVSFYASYRCGSCSEEHETLFLIPRDRDMIRDLPGSHHECPTCGGRARLEDYPAAFFDTIAERPAFDIDDEALGFFRSQLNYGLVPDLDRFRAFRRVHKGYTYLRLSGNLGTLASEPLVAATEGTTVIDLEGIVFDSSYSLSEWRAYLRTVLFKVKSLQLLSCPLGFLEHAVGPQDLRDKLKVRTFALAYDCLRCETTMPHMVDVAENLEQLVAGTAPTALCPTCGSSLVAIPTANQVAFMRALPARDRDPALDKFLATARAEPSDKLENCLIALPSRLPGAPAGTRRMMYLALGLAMLIIGGLAVVIVTLLRQRGAPVIVAAAPAAVVAPKPSGPTFERPAWIMSDIPSSAYCHDMINRLMCIGVSSYRATRDEAVAEASDAALEELVSAVGLKISDPFFRETVVAGYAAARAKALSALQATDLDQTSAAYTTANDVVAKVRRRVVEILRASGGAAVPSQRSDWYWEEYAAKKGGTETLVFVRYDVTLDAVKSLVDKYSAATPVLGSATMTAFPELAWRYPDFAGGAMVTRVGHPMVDAGVGSQNVVTAVGDHRVIDAVSFARRVEEAKQATAAAQAADDLKLTVKAGEAPAHVIEVKRPH